MKKLIKKMAILTTTLMMVQPGVCTQAAIYEHIVGSYHTSTYYDNKNICCSGGSEDFEDVFYYDGPTHSNGRADITNTGQTTMYYMILDPNGKRIVYNSIEPECGTSISVPFTSKGQYTLYMFDETANDGYIGTASVHILYQWS